MSNAPRLTSRNLFDAVFATIPADVVLHTGPETLREKCALAASRHTARANEDEEAGKQGAVDAYRQGEEGPPFESTPRGGGARSMYTNVVDVGALMRNAAKEKEKDNAAPFVTNSNNSNTAAAAASLSSWRSLNVQLDANDDAVREATKYAVVFAEKDEELEEITETEGDEKKRNGEGHGNSSSHTLHANSRHNQRQAVSESTDMVRRRSLTAEEQTDIMRPEEGVRHEGRCAMFRHNKGFGFITPEVGGPDVYFTRDDVKYFFTRRVLEVYFNGNLPSTVKRGGGGGGESSPQIITPGNHRKIHKDSTAAVKDASSSFTSTTTTTTTTAGTTNAQKKKNMSPNEMTVESNERVITETSNRNNEENDTGSTIRASGMISEEEAKTQKLVQEAAALLTPEKAQLLLSFLQLGKSILFVNENVTFTTRWNRTGSHEVRRLRADAIRGLPANGYALVVEQAWFEYIFPRTANHRYDDNNKNNTNNYANAAAHSDGDKCLKRHSGTVRSYDEDEQRGVIRPDESGEHGVVFCGDAFLWDARMEPARCRPAVGLVVNYTTASRDRHGKTIATLITAPDDCPLNETNIVWASGVHAEENERRQQGGGGGRDASLNGGASGAGGGDNRDEDTSGRKRAREEDLPLLEEDDYGIM